MWFLKALAMLLLSFAVVVIFVYCLGTVYKSKRPINGLNRIAIHIISYITGISGVTVWIFTGNWLIALFLMLLGAAGCWVSCR